MEILKDFVMPATASVRSSVESKYLTNAQKTVICKLAIKEAVILPFLGGNITTTYQRSTVAKIIGVQLAEECKTKNFLVGIIPDKGIAVQRLADKELPKEQKLEEPTDEAAAKKAEAAAKKAAKKAEQDAKKEG